MVRKCKNKTQNLNKLNSRRKDVKFTIRFSKDSSKNITKASIFWKNYGEQTLKGQIIFAADCIKIKKMSRGGFGTKLNIQKFLKTNLNGNLMNLWTLIGKTLRENYFVKISKTKRGGISKVNIKKLKMICSKFNEKKKATNYLQNREKNGNIKIATSTTKGAPPVPLSWRTGGCQMILFIVVFSCLINGVEGLEDTTIAIISFTSPFIACLAFWVSICLLKKLRTNDTDSKKETKMEEGKQLQKILITKEETTEEEDPSTIEIDVTQASELDNGGHTTEEEKPSTIEIDVTQASELDNGVDKQEISEKEAVLVQNVQKNVLLKRSKSVTNLSIADRSLKRSCSCRQINMEM